MGPNGFCQGLTTGHDRITRTMPLTAGTLLGPYAIVSTLGAGGMG